MTTPAELRALADRCKAAGSLPEHLRDAELQLIDRAIRDLELVEEGRGFRFYTRDLSKVKLLVPQGYEWAAGVEDGSAFACVHPPDIYLPLSECLTPELSLCAAALEAQARVLEAQSE